MGFIGIYKAIYDYAPQSDGELAITEGNILYLLEKDGGDGWWKAKKKASGDDDEEPEGLIPNNYVEEAQPIGHAKALYEYTRQTDEELSFPDDARLAIYDTSDSDWILAGYEGEFGFVPANYIDLSDSGSGSSGAREAHEPESESEPAPPALPSRQPAAAAAAPEYIPNPQLPPRAPSAAEPRSPASSGPAAALANVLAGRAAAAAPSSPATPITPNTGSRPRFMSDASDEADPLSPPLPTRPRPQQHAHFDAEEEEFSPPLPQRHSSTSYNNGSNGNGNGNHNDSNQHSRGSLGFGKSSGAGAGDEEESSRPISFSPGAFHMYNISEMMSVMGKRKKMPTTLGINLKTGVILIAPERVQDGPSQEWTAEKMTHYSREGKHVFMELVRPSKSVDFHAGAKDTAEEIVAALGELAGAVRAEGLREVIMAGSGKELKKAVVLYDFMAQGEDEVTVAVGDEVIILDDTRSEEWCQVRRVKNGKEGVVPSSYVEVTGAYAAVPSPTTALPPLASPRSPKTTAASTAAASATTKNTVAHNRMEEERMTRDVVRAAVRDESRRGGSEQRSKRENGSSRSKSKPDPSKVRTWTDRTKSFTVEAQFLGLSDNKINLHKMNGVKIAVPVAKMSLEDLEYVERATGVSLDEDKPLSSMKKKHQQQRQQAEEQNASGLKVGASIVEPGKPEYDWFQLFLSCEVAVGLCERYAQAFVKDNIDESVLPDIDATVLRTLGLREGDIIKVMRHLDARYGRSKKKNNDDDGEGGGGLFSGPGGTLRNNTRRGRPTPATQASDVVDAKAFSMQATGDSGAGAAAAAAASTNGNANMANGAGSSRGVASPASPGASRPAASGFDDDAWDVKPARQQASSEAKATVAEAAPAPAAPAPALAPPKPMTAALTGSLQELSLLTQPLPAEKLNPVIPAAVTSPPPQQPQPILSLPPQPTGMQQMPGATPGLFAGIAQQQQLQQQPTGLQMPQMTGAYGRARPLAPQYTQTQGGLLPPPPPTRPLSAPQSAQPSAFGPPPLQPQMTGMVTGQVAPPGQSLNDMNQARMQQQYLKQMQTGMMQQQPTGMMPQGMMPQATGMMPMMTGMGMAGMTNQLGQPMQMQATGFPGGGGLNSVLPPALEPQRTAMPGSMMPQPTGMMQSMQPMQMQPTGMMQQGMMPQPTGMMQTMQQQQPMQMQQPLQAQPTGHFTQGFGNQMTAGAPQQLQPPTPLMPQKTGPPPPVRFGVKEDAKKLTPQATGRRANLNAATPDNPFGF